MSEWQTQDTNQAVFDGISPDELSEWLKQAGYRTTLTAQDGVTQLTSASQGVGFVVRFGNAGPRTGTHLDFTLSCAMQVQGELPVELVDSWNRSKRFARLWVQAPFLVLEMDAMLAGGVTQRHVASLIELWDRLLKEYLLHLRRHSATSANEAAGAAAQS